MKKKLDHYPIYLLIGAFGLSLYLPAGFAQAQPEAARAAQTSRDGQHDFDFELGTWKIHLERLVQPLTGSSTWVQFDGTSVTRKLWDGRAQLEQFETDNPTTGHIEGLTLRLYNPESHQWSLYWASGKDGVLGIPPNIGEFKNGRGEFCDQELYQGNLCKAGLVGHRTEFSPL
jgi:hypothetical protein